MALRIYLVLIALANIAGIANLALNYEELTETFPQLNLAFASILIVMGIASLFAILLIWLWKISGIVTLGAAYLVMLLINLAFEAPLVHTLFGPVVFVILLALAWPNRQRFKAAPAGD